MAKHTPTFITCHNDKTMNSCFCGKKKNEQEKVVVRKKEGVGGSPLLLLPFSSSLGAHLMLPKTLSAFQYPFTNRKECYMTTIPCLHLEKPLEYVLTTLVTPFFDLFAYLSVFTFRLFFSLFSWEFPKLLPFFLAGNVENWICGSVWKKKEENLSSSTSLARCCE